MHGLIFPGDHVDVVSSNAKQDLTSNRNPIVRNVLVVAVGSMIEKNGKILSPENFDENI